MRVVAVPSAGLAEIVVVLLVLYAVATHFWLFLFTIGPIVAVALLTCRWVWNVKDRRRAARSKETAQ